jgi:hypothetical protein
MNEEPPERFRITKNFQEKWLNESESIDKTTDSAMKFVHATETVNHEPTGQVRT